MQINRIDRASAQWHSLRFVFSDAVVWLNVAAGATYGEIARSFSEASCPRYGDPLAINVVLDSRREIVGVTGTFGIKDVYQVC